MFSNPSFYEILGVPEDSSLEKIKSAFRRLALVHHPDKNNNSPESQAYFVVLLNAYNILVDPVKRREYDTYLGIRHIYHKPGGVQREAIAALPGREGDRYRSDEELLNHFNFLLWDIEDIIRNKDKPDRNHIYSKEILEQCLLKILVFIDKWVLEPAGFPDYFMEARKLGRMDPAEYITTIGSDRRKSGHRPFVNSTDYFYDIRKRMDRFLKYITIKDLVQIIPGYKLRLIDCIMEAQNYAIHYLGCLFQIRSGARQDIPPFTHSDACFGGEP